MPARLAVIAVEVAVQVVNRMRCLQTTVASRYKASV